ncbi:hypothetical protein PQI66_14510 [Corynebacterium sp. USCH3]|uniref:hypothetical protein n=1 Tax=Corynebacterium sp. USCH3 TaxID=3024840 RepID=UPI0030965E48
MTTPRFWTTQDLRAAGKTHSDIAGAVRRGEVFRITRDLYSAEEPDDLVKLKALSWARPEMVYTGDTAAFLHGLVTMRWPAHGRVPRTRSRDGGELLTLTGAVTRRTCRRWGVTTLTPLETAATAGSVALPARRALLERAYSGVKGNDRLATDLAALPPSVRAKATALTDGLITGAASELELKAVRVIVAALDGLDVEIQVNGMIRGYRFDVVIPGPRVCIEIDSSRYHSARSARREDFIKDRWKGNAAVRWGWTLLRYPDVSIDKTPDAVGEEVRDTVTYNLAYPRTRRQRTHEIPTDRPIWLQ